MPNPDRLAINLATLGPEIDLRTGVESCARQGIRAIGAGCQQVEAAGLREAARILRSSGMRVTSLSRAGFLTVEDGQERRRRRDANRRAIEAAATIGAECLIVVVGGLPPRSKDLGGARHMVEDGMTELLDDATSAGVRLAIEPLHPLFAAEHSVVTTLGQALDMAAQLGSDSVGVMVDTFHVWWDPALEAQLERAGSQRLLGLQLADWMSPAADAGPGAAPTRGMMGQGCIDIARLRKLVDRLGYAGQHEVEVTGGSWSGGDPYRVLQACLEAYERAC